MARGDRMSEERQLALLVTTAADYAIFMLDPQGQVLTWNTGAERLKGYRREEIVGKHFSAFYTDEDRAREHPAEELRIALRTGATRRRASAFARTARASGPTSSSHRSVTRTAS